MIYRVILADDSIEFLRWFNALLQSSQAFQVVGSASNGTEALDLVRLHEPDLLIVDVDMPGLDGLDVAQLVQDQWPHVGVILVSSHTDSYFERMAKEVSALAFIPKARVSLDTLSHVLGEEK
jgi:YesN/AraC family two-component response regulator